MITDITAPCIRCGRPAQPQVHHGREDNLAMGKGMGGAKDWPEHDLYDICDPDHKALHNKEWTFQVTELSAEKFLSYFSETPEVEIPLVKNGEPVRWVLGENADGSTFERPLQFDNDNPSPAWWGDGKLGTYWEWADANRMKHRATVANIFKKRWGWGKGWAKRAADAMGGGAHGSGQQISESTVRRSANVWKHWNGNWELMKQLGSVTVAYAVASAEDTDRALEIAEKETAAGKKAKHVVALIQGKSVNAAQKEMCVCPDCGAEHTKKGG